MKTDVLGSGWCFPVQIDTRGGVAVAEYEEKVKQSIRIILGTAKGERVMRPDFGCGIHDFVFSVIDTSTLTMIKSAVREALVLWEPRIELLDVTASLDGMPKGRLNIQVNYRVRATNTEANLVYPFYVNDGA